MTQNGGWEHPFAGKRVLVTSADHYMGPAICRQFAKAGAEIIQDLGRYDSDPDEPGRVVAAAGHIDVLVVNLLPQLTKRQRQVDASEDDWQSMFDAMAHPTARFVRAVLPQMIERAEGKIIVVTSAAPLRGVPATAAYTAARGAQNAYVLAVGTEVAPDNVQINAIAQILFMVAIPTMRWKLRA